MSEHIFATRNKPKLARLPSGTIYSNSLRVYKASPVDIMFQVRLTTQYISVALNPDEAERLAKALLAVVALFKVQP